MGKDMVVGKFIYFSLVGMEEFKCIVVDFISKVK